jgi:hypothetical protein
MSTVRLAQAAEGRPIAAVQLAENVTLKSTAAEEGCCTCTT